MSIFFECLAFLSKIVVSEHRQLKCNFLDLESRRTGRVKAEDVRVALLNANLYADNIDIRIAMERAS